jgi:hypothetical protein
MFWSAINFKHASMLAYGYHGLHLKFIMYLFILNNPLKSPMMNALVYEFQKIRIKGDSGEAGEVPKSCWRILSTLTRCAC